MDIEVRQPAWQVHAECRGPIGDVFYPPSWPERRDERDAREARAKAICAECQVRSECLDHALALREQHGIWGGLTETERRELMPAR